MTPAELPAPIALERIGTVRCAAPTVESVPSEGLPSRVVLDERYRAALRGVTAGDHLYVLAIFDRADGSLTSGSPGTPHEQGAFSIRSSSRPNRIGMTLATVTGIDGCNVDFDWLDFADGTPVVDLKRYNWRWECVLAARRLDRRHIERQIDRRTLAAVLTRPAANFHGERCDAVVNAGILGAQLVHDHDVWLGSPDLCLAVEGSGHLIDALQGLSGATLGNGRLEILSITAGDDARVRLSGHAELEALLERGTWRVEPAAG